MVNYEEYILAPGEVIFYENRNSLTKVLTITREYLLGEPSVYEFIPAIIFSEQNLINIAERQKATQLEKCKIICSKKENFS